MPKYEVVGSTEVLGHPPGSVIELALTEEQEKFYTDAGHLAKAGNKSLKEGEQVTTPAQEASAKAAAEAQTLREGETQTPEVTG